MLKTSLLIDDLRESSSHEMVLCFESQKYRIIIIFPYFVPSLPPILTRNLAKLFLNVRNVPSLNLK